MSYQLLICTVGGAPEPIVASVLAHRPERLIFVVSRDTRSSVAESISPKLAAHETPFALEPGRYDFVELSDAQDFGQCVRELRGAQARHVAPWLARGGEFCVTVDFTGGTKCMTSALALVARRWNCRFSHVGGTQRTKEGVGIVVSGKEQVIHSANPWDALGYEAVEQAVVLFNHGDLAAAARVVETAKQRAGESVKRGLNTLHQLCEGYDLWDRFQHRDARSRFANVLKAPHDLLAWFPSSSHKLIRTVESHVKWIERLPHESQPFLSDLIANADRCAGRRRFDDSVARLYRACEAAAQFQLVEHKLADRPDGKVALDRLPDPFRTDWAARATDGVVMLRLQDDYALLAAIDAPLGRRFLELQLHSRHQSPLTERNGSILAHGQSPISSRGYDLLRSAIGALLDLKANALPQFPVLEDY
jgi:CRISPR-associated protein (TIGR02710 family)